MEFGKMDRQITIQTDTPVQDDYGEPVVSWAELDVVWAQVVPDSGLSGGREGNSGEGIAATQRARFRIRYRTDVTPLHRISWNSLIWDIVSVREVGRQEATDILAVAQTP